MGGWVGGVQHKFFKTGWGMGGGGSFYLIFRITNSYNIFILIDRNLGSYLLFAIILYYQW